ncbi:Mannosyl-oligosaccharide 1,2-alpha-mannosidase IB [Liparis tanakae]|uniref:Mannosyl-oligosaccharide 1,2-alpha-mannosidase IB n=1 Tax=Liparis tanakae TaxID=230148 RepID=A0A4Z2F534_9TELE|nr:Mannosyl-oligosaccharide 1,2-alpha-mannosidase IB [Liparis tanakae]
MTTPALLPLSGRRIPTLSPGGASSFPHHRATLRLSEKFILLLILSAFITLCFGAFFFLPDNSKHKRFDLGLEDVLIPHIDSPKEGKHASGQVVIHGQGGHDEHRHSLWLLLEELTMRYLSQSPLLSGTRASLPADIMRRNVTQGAVQRAGEGQRRLHRDAVASSRYRTALTAVTWLLSLEQTHSKDHVTAARHQIPQDT